MRVLVVEAEVRLAENIAAGLREGAGYAVDIVHHGHDAIQLCWTSSYDLIVLDLMIPGLSGEEVVRQLRAGRYATPILVLTAVSETGNPNAPTGAPGRRWHCRGTNPRSRCRGAICRGAIQAGCRHPQYSRERPRSIELVHPTAAGVGRGAGVEPANECSAAQQASRFRFLVCGTLDRRWRSARGSR